MIDICDTCAFCDACPSAHFHPTGKSDFCADYRTMLRAKRMDTMKWIKTSDRLPEDSRKEENKI